jgi:hypothetical protein
MKRLAIIFIFAILLSSIASATISPVGGAVSGSCASSGPTATCTLSASPPSGDYMVVFLKTGGASTPYCQDNNVHTLIQGPAVILLTGDALTSFGIVSYSGLTSVTCYWLGGTVNSMAAEWYSGASGFNLQMTGGSALGTSTAPSISPTLDDANDYAVCAFADTSTAFTTPYTGTLRQTTSTGATMVIVDNTSASTGAITVSGTLASSVAWKAACVELRTVASTAQFTEVQFTPVGFIATAGPPTCVYSSATCTWQIQPTVAGTLLAVVFSDHLDGSAPQRTITTIYDCATSPCTSGNTIDTFTLPGATCQAYVVDSNSGSQSVDCAYVLSGAGGANYITATRSGNTSIERQGYAVAEVSCSCTFVLDAIGTATVSTAANTFNITSVSITHTNDVIMQGLAGGVAPSIITAPYYQGESVPNHQGFWLALNTNNGAAPTITTSNGLNGAAGNALAFSATGGTPSTSKISPGVKITPGVKVTP